jgi:hypothetical protein
MPELDWQRYLERRPLLRVAPLRALLATLGVLLHRAPQLLLAGLPAYGAAVTWLLLRDRASRIAFGPGADFLSPLLVLFVDLVVLWLLVAFATAVPRVLLTSEPLRVLPRLDRAERRSAAIAAAALLAAALLALLADWALPAPFADWQPRLFVFGLVDTPAFLLPALPLLLPGCLLLALLAPLLPAAALGPGFRGRQLSRVSGGSWPANLLVVLLGAAAALAALLAVHGLARGLDHVGLLRLLLAAALPAVVLLAAAVLQAGFAVVFARRIGWTSGPAAAT